MIAQNQVVVINYAVRDKENGELLDSNENAAPLEFILGRGEVILGLENAVAQMKIGDKKELEIAPNEAYGERDERGVQIFPRESFSGLELQIGQTLFGQDDEGRVAQAVVADFTDNEVKMDFNHPLAGKTLLFSVEILSAREATTKELENGMMGCGCGLNDECGCHDSNSEDLGGCCGGAHHAHGGCCGKHH